MQAGKEFPPCSKSDLSMRTFCWLEYWQKYWSGRLIAISDDVAPTYHLIRPIFGFLSECGTTVTIPATAVLQVVISKNGLGLCTALWEGRLVMAFRKDIEENSMSLEESSD